MKQWWDRYPVAVAADGTLMIYPDQQTRDRRLAEHAKDPTRNDYLTSYVHLDEQVVTLSVTGETLTTPWLHEFVVVAESRWSARLLYFDEPVPADDILAATGD